MTVQQVKLMSSDGQSFDVDRNVAEQSKTIAGSLEGKLVIFCQAYDLLAGRSVLIPLLLQKRPRMATRFHYPT